MDMSNKVGGPDALTLTVCQSCSRTDRWQQLSARHFRCGKLCPGPIEEVAYFATGSAATRLDLAADEIADAFEESDVTTWGAVREWLLLLAAHADDERRGERPLVILDPEDPAQVGYLMSLLADTLQWGDHNFQRQSYLPHLESALREFAKRT